jgi:hypothetical protein
MGPFLCDLGSWMMNERSSTGKKDMILLTLFLVIRFALLIGFLYNLNYKIKSDWNCLNRAYFIFWFIAFLVVFAFNFFTESKAKSYEQQNIRVAINNCEMIAIPILIVYHYYLIEFMDKKFKVVTDKSIRIIQQRRIDFDVMLE